MSFKKDFTELIQENSNGLLATHESWTRVNLRDIAFVKNGYAFKSKYFNKKNGTPLIRIRDIVRSQTDTLYNGPIDENYWVTKGDLLIGMDGDFNAARWKSAPALLNQRVCKVVPVESYSTRFLSYVLPGYLDAVNTHTSSVTVKHISSKTINSIPLPLPPFKEQERIANKVDALFGRNETAKKMLDSIPQLVDRYKASIFKKYLLGGLLDSSDCKETAAISIGLPPVELKSGWAWHKLTDIAKLESGHTPKKSNPLFWKDGNIPWISLKDIRAVDQKVIFSTSQNPNQYGIDNSSARLLPKGTVVLSRDISVGYVTIMGREMATSQHFANWVCGEKINNFYLQYALASSRDYLLNSGQGTTVKTIYMPALKQIYIALPSLDKQKEIVQSIKSNFSRINEIQSMSQFCEEQIIRLKQSILKRAVSGYLVPQDPKDEPVEVLLQKIRIERSILEKEQQTKIITGKRKSNKDRSMIISVEDALIKSETPLSSQQLLSAAGYPNNSSTDQIERFFLDIRTSLENKKIEVSRKDKQDYFKLVA